MTPTKIRNEKLAAKIIKNLERRHIKGYYCPASITYGPKTAIIVLGVNKVAQDVEAALKRARSTSAPINTARFDIDTPCKIDGVCHNCNSADCICNYIHVLRNSPKGKHQVVIVGENLGY